MPIFFLTKRTIRSEIEEIRAETNPYPPKRLTSQEPQADDFSLAAANSLVAVEAGAEVVHQSPGHWRAFRRDATEEVAIALKYTYALDPGLCLVKMMETTGIIQEISGIVLPGHKPVVGENYFSYEAGISAMFSRRVFKNAFPLGVMPYMPETVEHTYRIAIEKKSGQYNLFWHLDKTGRSADEDQLWEMVDRVKQESTRKRRALNEAEVEKIYDEVYR